MSTSAVFDWLCAEIGTLTGFDTLKSRGTLRLALQGAGLEPRTLTKAQAEVVIARVLPRELELRGIANADTRCVHLSTALRLMSFAQTGPESAGGRRRRQRSGAARIVVTAAER
jgi:hypothetical protein